MPSSEEDIDAILSKWDSAKKKISVLKDKIKKYRSVVSKKMDRDMRDKIIGRSYTVSRKKNTKKILSKSSIPEALWKEYCTEIVYDSYFVHNN